MTVLELHAHRHRTEDLGMLHTPEALSSYSALRDMGSVKVTVMSPLCDSGIARPP